MLVERLEKLRQNKAQKLVEAHTYEGAIQDCQQLIDILDGNGEEEPKAE